MTIRAALIGAAGLTTMAAAQPARSPAPRLLLPVTDADAARIEGMGCESWFTQGNTGYAFLRNSTLMVRTALARAGLSVCELTALQVDDFGYRGKQMVCGGRRLMLRRTGPASGHAEADSSDAAATLTIADGARSATLRGRFGTAC
ncbi:hypothetical protein [Sphingomonas sp.]|uniref:hypothetical protein n=1 Tax=Sphingomonas sp. TaxID=28214 RepID=UPI003AFFD088